MRDVYHVHHLLVPRIFVSHRDSRAWQSPFHSALIFFFFSSASPPSDPRRSDDRSPGFNEIFPYTRRVIRKTCKWDGRSIAGAVRFVVGQGTGREINSTRVISFNLDLRRERETLIWPWEWWTGRNRDPVINLLGIARVGRIRILNIDRSSISRRPIFRALLVLAQARPALSLTRTHRTSLPRERERNHTECIVMPNEGSCATCSRWDRFKQRTGNTPVVPRWESALGECIWLEVLVSKSFGSGQISWLTGQIEFLCSVKRKICSRCPCDGLVDLIERVS